MARHSKWHNIKHRKWLQDAKKWKIYSLHAKLITLSAQSWWWDPDKNPNLANAIAIAKAEWVPNENIDRAIKRWTWENKDWANIQEIVYEWYWAWWVAMMVKVLTDNKNRTASSIRHIFTKYGWSMWEFWSVSWMFNESWVIIIDSSKYDYDEIEEIVFETNAKDIIKEEDIIKIITAKEDLDWISNILKEKGIELDFCWIDFIAENEIELTDFDKVLKIKKMLESFDEDEDVESVSSNEVISQELSDNVDKFIEENTFRT